MPAESDRKEENMNMKMKCSRKKVLAVLVAVLCLSVTIGGAMAYFTDYEDAYGGAVLRLDGETTIDEGNVAGEKNITITNTGEVSVLVRVGIFGDEKYLQTPSYTDADWIPYNGFYYYRWVLEPGKQTSVIKATVKDEWKGEKASIPEEDFEITVVHESVPAYENGEIAFPEGWYTDVKEAA